MQRADAAFVVMREEFGFVRRYIDADRAIALAAFAAQAEIKRVLDFFAAPAVADDFAFGHLPEQAGAPTGRVFFFVRGAIAGAHQAAIFAAALAHPYAAQRGMGEAALIVGE